MATDPDDELDGCAVVLEGVPGMETGDDDVDALVLFADVDFDDPDEVASRVREYEELFGDGS